MEMLSRLGPDLKMRFKIMCSEEISKLHLDLERVDNERARGKIELLRKFLQYLEMN